MNKLAIVGTHSATRDNAPFDDLNYDIWVFNEAPQAAWCKRWDVDFQLHKPEVYRSANNMSNKEHWSWLKECHGKAIYMQEEDPEVPDSLRFPIEEILLLLPEDSCFKWFDLSAAYALALAIRLGYEKIEIYGMDLVSNTEYSYQLRCWNFWVGIAIGRGVDISLKCSKNDFSSGRMYGYEGEIQIERKYFFDRSIALGELYVKADRALEKAKNKINDAILAFNHKDLPDLVKEYQEMAIAAGELAGAQAEAENYAQREDPISAQEFERRSAKSQREAEDIRNQMYNLTGKIEYVWLAWQATRSYEAASQLRMFIGQMGQRAYEVGGMTGAFRENRDYMLDLNKRITAAGGLKTVKALESADVSEGVKE